MSLSSENTGTLTALGKLKTVTNIRDLVMSPVFVYNFQFLITSGLKFLPSRTAVAKAVKGDGSNVEIQAL